VISNSLCAILALIILECAIVAERAASGGGAGEDRAATDGMEHHPWALRPVDALAYRLTDLATCDKISCRYRIRSCMSLQNNFLRRLVVDRDTACNSIVPLVLRLCSKN
jgi:hypothetical protein